MCRTKGCSRRRTKRAATDACRWEASARERRRTYAPSSWGCRVCRWPGIHCFSVLLCATCYRMSQRNLYGKVVLTVRGKPVASPVPIENADLETVSLGTHPQLLALIERNPGSVTKRKAVSQARRCVEGWVFGRSSCFPKPVPTDPPSVGGSALSLGRRRCGGRPDRFSTRVRRRSGTGLELPHGLKVGGFAMSELEQLEQQVLRLSPEDLAIFRAWFIKLDHQLLGQTD